MLNYDENYDSKPHGLFLGYWLTMIIGLTMVNG